MKISFNPSNSNKNILDLIKNNKDIIFDLKGHSIFARGVEFKGTDTNTWRDIKINNVSIGSHTLDLRNGSNTTLTNTNGVVTINSTWRPVVDNLTSDSTTSSLSAKQGKVLKALIDGKSNSDHNHDGRYVRYYAVTTLDCNNLAAGLTAARISATNAAHTNHSAYLYISDVGTPFQIQIPDSSIPYIYKRYYGSGKWSGWFKLNAGYADSAGSVAWANVTGKPSSYTPSAHTHAWNSLTHSSTTENQAILTNGKANGWKLQTLNIARWDNAANNAHSHANKSVLDGITSALVNSWNTAYNFVSNITGTDTDKVINKWEEIVNFLAGITEDNKLNTLLNSKLSIQQLSAKDILTTKTNNALFWVDTKGNASTITTGPFTDHPYALLSVTNYNQNAENHKFFYRSRLAFSSAGDIKVASCHHEYEYQQDETWYNVLTSKNSGISGSTIKLNGTSITVYSSGTADGRYVKKSGDTMQGVLTIDTPNFGALTIKRNDDANGASIQFRGKSSVYGYIGLNNSTKDKQFLRWSSDISRIYTILDTSSTYISNGKGVINGTTITQVDNATNSTNSTNARKLVNWYSARPTSLNAQFGDGSLRIFYATSSTTEGKPAEDSHILHLAWDNTGGWDAQLAVHTRSGKVSTRAQNGGTWQPWKTLAFITDIPTSLKNPYSFNVFGVVYDGSAAKTVTTSNFISQVNEGSSTITDGTMLITSYASNSGFADTNAVNVPYKRKAIHLWEYIKTKTDSLYATKGHNHDGRYVRAFGTSNDNIDSDWGQSFKTFDPIPLGTPPEKNPNISLLSIGENFNRRKQLAFIWNNDNIYYRRHTDSGFTNWRRLAFANEIPTSLKNPYALTISLNGTSQGPYDGSAAKNINITPGSIGAAVSNHSHDYLVVNSADDKSFNSAYHNFQVLYAGGGNGITGKPANVDAFGLFKFRAASGCSGQMLLANGGSLYIRSSEDAKMTNTLAWKTILDSSNYSGILDSRYYTESEVNSLLSRKLDRVNLTTGSWNPRGYHLAADYHYNGGDLSISESGGKIYVSVDGCFWQNEGQYRVLDTSDIGDIRDSVTLHQYLSATDAAWYPLVWGGASHNNTSDSTGPIYKSYDKLSWQTSSQTLYATNIQTNNIKKLSIGGGIYWNPNVESASDGSDAASITLVRSGVAGGTTLVLSQMNDTNDTIQFKTNTAARLYHNNYPILTTQNTYVSNNKGYINGTEITQVNNADKVDNRHAISTTPNTGIIYKAAIYTAYSLTSYWVRLASIPSIDQNSEFVATIHVQSGHSGFGRNAILLVYLRGGASSYLAKGFNICCNSNYDPNRFRLYYKDSDKTSEIWYNTVGQWDGIITTVISQSSEGSLYERLTLYSGIITAVQTPSMSTYLSAQVSTITDNISGNASTATKLQTPRTIWGQSFDGTGNVSGSLSEVGNIHFKVDNSYDIGSDAAASRYIYTHWLGARSGRKLELGANNSGFGQGLCIDTNLNVGIGTNSPTQKLDVIGNIRATGQLYLPTNGNYNAILMGDDCWMGDCNINNVIGLSGTGNANSGGIKFGKGGMYIGYNGSSHYSSGTSLWSNFNADLLDGLHSTSFAPYNGVKFGHSPDANIWHRILQFTTNWVGQVTFMYSPEECQRSYWGIFNINIRSKDIWFRGFSFANLPQIKCCGDDNNNWSVWIKGSANSYDPYGVIQILNFSNASIVSVGLNKSQTTEPSGTYNKAPDLFQAGSVNWSDITNKIVAGNQFNVVNAGYNNQFWFNYLPINDRNNIATISTYCMGNGKKNYASVTASGFIKNGGNENQLLRADGGVAAFNWAGQSGQPTWLWGGNDFNSYYVYNPSNFRVAYASSAGNADTLDGEHASSFVRAGHYESNDLNKLDTYSFIRSVNSNVSSTSPKGNTGWYNVIQLVHRNGASDGPSYIGQIALGMTTNTNDMFFRGKRTDPWKTVIHSGNIGSQSVNSAQYLRSLGNQNCQTGRTQAYGDVYTYNTITGNTGSPTTYSSVIGFGRGTGGTVEIAGGWCNTHLYWRSLRDCCEDWFPWRVVLDSSNYTEFINNYYWANVKISASSSTTTSPTVSNLTATSSIRMSNISLEHTDEINNSANGGIHLNYRNSGNVSLCYGGGNVGIGTTTPSYKLDVNGQMRASGFHHASVNSDNYMLLAGGGYKSFGGDDSTPIFLGCLDLYRGGDGTISSSFYCLGYSVPFTYTRGGNYCKIIIPDTTRLSFYIIAATASVNYSGGGMDTWTGYHRGSGAWWLHCYAFGWNEVRVKGFCQADKNNDSWWGGNPLWNNEYGANRITVCIFGHVKYK